MAKKRDKKRTLPCLAVFFLPSDRPIKRNVRSDGFMKDLMFPIFRLGKGYRKWRGYNFFCFGQCFPGRSCILIRLGSRSFRS